MEERIEQLTEAQRECLRLVLHRYSSKEMARMLGVSPSAVDKRIERAVQVLGASSRFAAARALATHEDDASDSLPWEAIDVPPAPGSSESVEASEPWWLVRRLLGVPPRRSDAGIARVRLNAFGRLGLVLATMFVIALTTLILLDLGTTLSSLIGGDLHRPVRVLRR